MEGLAPHYMCVLTRPNRLDEMTVQVEAHSVGLSHDERRRLSERLVAQVKHNIGVSVKVEVLEPQTLERSLGKAKRISDQRHLT